MNTHAELEAVELWLEAAAGVAPRCQNLNTFMERIHEQELRRDTILDALAYEEI